MLSAEDLLAGSALTFEVVVPDDVVATSDSGLLPIVGGASPEPADTTPPASTALVDPAPGTTGWNNGPVTVHIGASDADGGSGVASITVATSGSQSEPATRTAGNSVDVPVSAEGTTTVTYSAADAAGNVEAPRSVTVRIDRTPPAVVFSGNAGSYTADQQVAIACQAADALSGARPGARREMLETYVKRLQDLERIGNSFKGVTNCFAIQAGREIRIMVSSDEVSDEQSFVLARDVARKIEGEMTYPGQIKVNVIRETRAIEYAK